ncbi:Uncharacterised protein [Citrobacter koseri]|nr:Uncharacterised protein [Citrobacter koseri]
MSSFYVHSRYDTTIPEIIVRFPFIGYQLNRFYGIRNTMSKLSNLRFILAFYHYAN